ncbi:hypothetical protein BSU04_10365 [Caballeronia sordidicola]|uniref:Uncharacterized protein n=1 Tax=Caballeronia sordidicola TaxID=196367 RepID=A0A226X5J8_CABSO|nr:hypothetical protein BSU04_10365 [Caballeronia sordidicola]
MLAQKLGIFNENRFLSGDRINHRRHACIIAIANSNGLAILEIDAAEVLDKRGHEMLARLLAVTDDIDARMLLFLQ